jgi:predicted enzyme related to lactoylglutathione lyase
MAVTPTLGLVLDCLDPVALAPFWAAALGYRVTGEEGPYLILQPFEAAGPRFLLQRVPEAKAVKNRMHVDLEVGDIEGAATRLEGLGGRRLTDRPIAEDGCRWIVMADPEGNELCLCDHC